MCQIDCSFKSGYERHLKTMKHKHQASIHSLMADVDDGDIQDDSDDQGRHVECDDDFQVNSSNST